MTNFIYSAFCDESGESTIEGQMAVCKENAITHMELRGFGKGNPNINKIGVDTAKELKAAIDKEGMKVASIGSAYGKINIKEDFVPHFEAFKNTIEIAKILGAKYIRIFSFYFDENDNHALYRDEVIRRVKIMTDYANENGIIPCHENEKNIYGDTAERCLDILEALGGSLKAVFDPANFVQCGEDTLKAFEMLKGHIEYLHIKDALFKDSSVVPAGKGDGNVEAILTAVNKWDKDIILSLEPHLQVFDGLKDLEEKDESAKAMPDNVYASHKESFAVASEAMHALVNKIQGKEQ